MRLLLCPLVVTLLTVSAALHAESPEAVVTRQVEAMRAGDWEKFTACMYGPTLQDFQGTVLSLLTNSTDAVKSDQIRTAFFGDKSIGDLTATPPSAFFRLFMEGLARTNPALKQSMTGASGEVLGHVDEGADTAHVVTRMSLPLGEGRLTKMEVTTLQRDGDTWKALLKGDMQAVVAGVQRMLQAK